MCCATAFLEGQGRFNGVRWGRPSRPIPDRRREVRNTVRARDPAMSPAVITFMPSLGSQREGTRPGLLRTVYWLLASTACYYVATQIAWSLTFPDSKVSLFFPPQAVLLCVLLLVPTRHWWAYVLAAAGAHFLATR